MSQTLAQKAETNSGLHWDVQRLRRDFPILSTLAQGKPLVYLDNAATSQKPQIVIDRLAKYYESENANIHRGVHMLSEKATEEYEHARTKIQHFLNAKEAREIIFTRGATEAINLVAQTWGWKNIGAGDEILITNLEHHSNIVPWQMLCERSGAVLKVVPINDAGELILEEFEKLLGPKTKLLAVNQVSNGLGTINPVRWMIEKAHQLEPQEHNILDTIGWLRYKQGRLKDQPAIGAEGDDGGVGAATLIQRAIDDSTEPSPEVLDHMGDVQWRLGDTESALAAWKRVVNVLGDGAFRKQWLQQIALLQSRQWGIIVTDGERQYDRDYGAVLRRAQEKIDAVARGDQPAVAPIWNDE